MFFSGDMIFLMFYQKLIQDDSRIEMIKDIHWFLNYLDTIRVKLLQYACWTTILLPSLPKPFPFSLFDSVCFCERNERLLHTRDTLKVSLMAYNFRGHLVGEQIHCVCPLESILNRGSFRRAKTPVMICQVQPL